MIEEVKGVTGPEYTEEEEAILRAGVTLGMPAKKIAAKLPGRTVYSVYNAARLRGLDLSTKLTISRSGHVGVRAKSARELDQWQMKVDVITQRTGLSTFKDVWEFALAAAVEKVGGGPAPA